jgi:hypothetical protein
MFIAFICSICYRGNESRLQTGQSQRRHKKTPMKGENAIHCLARFARNYVYQFRDLLLQSFTMTRRQQVRENIEKPVTRFA